MEYFHYVAARIRVGRLRTPSLVKAVALLVGELLLLQGQQSFATDLKKVAVLEFVNSEKNIKIQYLENSLTSAVDTKLESLFAFQKPDKETIRDVAEKNFLYADDFASRSVALNLGLLAGQDVVIAGSFRARPASGGEELITTVRIFDIPNKKMLVEFTERSNVDGTIFDSVDKIADRIAKEARAVLPSKEDWARGGRSTSSGPWFKRPVLYLAGGGSMMLLDYSDRMEAQLPSLRAGIRYNVPAIWQALTLGLQGMYLREQPKADKNPAIEGLKIVTTTFMPGLYMGALFHSGNFQIHPRIGGGYAFQAISVSGARSEELSNMLPYAGGGLDLTYRLSALIGITMTLESVAQFQNGTTLFGIATLGFQLKL